MEPSNSIGEFIKNELDKIQSKFPQIKYRYVYDEMSQIHKIKISPDDIFKNKEFIKWKRNMMEIFIREYWFDGILIIPESDIFVSL